MMQTASYEKRHYKDVDALRRDLRNKGFAVAELYPPDHPVVATYEKGMDELAQALRPDGGSANGGRGMGGITKGYGAACHVGAAQVRLDPRAREVHAGIYGLDSDAVFTGWDAASVLGDDAKRSPLPRNLPKDPQKAYFAATGGSLQLHIDLDPKDKQSMGNRAESKMRELHPIFPHCVQSQFVCRSVPPGGATFVVVPGGVDEPIDPDHFVGGKGDFAVCTEAGYKHYRDKWRAVEAPKGCLILWLSKQPHGNKLADVGVDPQRRAVYIAWQDRRLVKESEREALKKRKLEAIYSGGSTDHWASHAPRIHRGSHYSNGQGKTKVLYNRDRAPEYPQEFQLRIEEAL